MVNTSIIAASRLLWQVYLCIILVSKWLVLLVIVLLHHHYTLDVLKLVNLCHWLILLHYLFKVLGYHPVGWSELILLIISVNKILISKLWLGYCLFRGKIVLNELANTWDIHYVLGCLWGIFPGWIWVHEPRYLYLLSLHVLWGLLFNWFVLNRILIHIVSNCT